MSKLLVKFDTNWADEMDISGYKVFTEIEWTEISDKCKAHKTILEAYFGTNESNVYDNGSELLEEYTVQKISESEAAVLDKLFSGKIGNFQNPLNILEGSDEEDEY